MMWGHGYAMGWVWLFWLPAFLVFCLIIFTIVWLITGGARRGRGTGRMETGRPLRPPEAEWRGPDPRGPGAYGPGLRGPVSDAPRRILDERYARGELTTQEYRERLRVLAGGPPEDTETNDPGPAQG